VLPEHNDMRRDFDSENRAENAGRNEIFDIESERLLPNLVAHVANVPDTILKSAHACCLSSAISICLNSDSGNDL
jgi:organic hydroperoxide reductase OsmC/OhrA